MARRSPAERRRAFEEALAAIDRDRRTTPSSAEPQLP
jgi:hypothetical protein